MSPTSVEPRAEDFPHRIIETLRFADTDRNGHITSSVFAICCQSGRLAAVGPGASGHAAVGAVRIGPAGARLSQGDALAGRRRSRHTDRAYRSIVHHPAQALFQNDRCVATARSVAVLMDTTSRRSQPIPLAATQNLRAFVRKTQRPDRPPDLPSSYYDAGVSLPRAPADQSSALRPADDL